MGKEEKKNTKKRGISIDIGEKNFCIYIEEFDIKNLHKIQNIPKSQRYNKDKTCTPAFRKILNEVYKEGKTLLLEKVNLTGKSRMEILVNLTNFLDKHKKLLDTIDVPVIEEQKKENNMARCLEQHCHSYFIFNYLDSKPVVIYPSKYKTQTLGLKKYAKGLKAYQKKKIRKDWCVEKALGILKLRDDKDTLEIIDECKKKDDFSDTICMFQSFKYKYFVDKTRIYGK
jgi:hypothetical protein